MPFEIIRNDITKLQVDAIVNAANRSLLGGGGVDGAIHRAAGGELLLECKALGGCETGQAKITKGYNLLAKHVIHTVGPVWQGGNNGEEQQLIDCYENSLRLAKEYNLESIAFPLISMGAYGYPKDKALKIALQTIQSFLVQNDMSVSLVVFDNSSFQLSAKLSKSIKQYIDDRYIEERAEIKPRRKSFFRGVLASKSMVQIEEDSESVLLSAAAPPVLAEQKAKKQSLNDVLLKIDETFSQRLLRLIDEKGKTDIEVYKKANIDRKLFSKIRSDEGYKPSKSTAIAFAIALELPLDDVKDLLKKAGFALSHSNKFDIIIEYFIENGIYNIFEINEALFAFEQTLLGV